MCYGENGTVKYLENMADNIFSHRYSMKKCWVAQAYTLKLLHKRLKKNRVENDIMVY